ncbi:hypothetical protein HYPSUDRAFT_428542 [Hypholoma sublateritium FD-334 SS-4]|uniref:Uncharacterized protein n=1 Tax=Hypholoma sublateritium (strain FD-334 SS-4) TaxID=945553 RepID=A0A0D2NDH9_HYPSF|nr:hypothetical protein HYPSUDRAFT_428542 [Hypholoma sublateritium FD-334 SS-4]
MCGCECVVSRCAALRIVGPSLKLAVVPCGRISAIDAFENGGGRRFADWVILCAVTRAIRETAMRVVFGVLLFSTYLAAVVTLHDTQGAARRWRFAFGPLSLRYLHLSSELIYNHPLATAIPISKGLRSLLLIPLQPW